MLEIKKVFNNINKLRKDLNYNLSKNHFVIKKHGFLKHFFTII